MKRILLLTAVVAAFLAGCAKPNPMVGTWKVQQVPRGFPSGSLEMNFKPDNTFDATIVEHGAAERGKGKYELKGKQLTLTVTEIGGEPPRPGDTPISVITLNDDMSSFTSKGLLVKKQ